MYDESYWPEVAAVNAAPEHCTVSDIPFVQTCKDAANNSEGAA